MLLDQRRPAVFLPADPPRKGRLALYGEGPDEIEPARSGTGWNLDAAPDTAALLAESDR